MGDALSRRLVQAQFDGPVHEAVLNLMVAAAHVREQLDRVCHAHGVSPAQYNVLRILRGSHPQGCPRCDVARRMIERAPDVTRLIDRLQAAGLVDRASSERDRRLSVTRITDRGITLLDRMRPDVDAVGRAWSERLSPDDARELSRLCERLYDGDDAAG
jgi:DNA-binding MarR family transcriptional regulator